MTTTQTSDIQKKYCSRAMMFSLAVAGMLILFDAKPEAKGLVLGTIFSIVNFVLMVRALPHRLNDNRKKAFMVSLGSIWIRYAILSIPLVIAFNSDALEFFAAAAGLFMIQIIILVHHLGGKVFGLAPYQ
jgi:branched-subunit amino acid transport protein AzlD